MKFKLTFMAVVSSLFMAACSSNDAEVNDLGAAKPATQALTFKLDLPQAEAWTRMPAESTSTSKQKQPLQINKLEVNLTADNFSKSGEWITIYGEGASSDISYTFEQSAKEFTLFGLNNPKNLKVRLNHKKQSSGISYSELADFQVANAEEIPAYGATEHFESNQGVTQKDGKKYDKITAHVQVKIPVARIELSGIQVTEGFEAINLKRIFINQVQTKVMANPANSTFTYSTPQVLTEENKSSALLADLIGLSALDPALSQKVYAYSIFPNKAEEMPKITLEFDQIQYAGQDQVQKEVRYAVITKLKGMDNFQFEAAKIYRIKNMKLSADNLGADITGNSQHALEVTLELAEWDIEDIDDISWN